MRVWEDLEPKRVFFHFENLCRVPHGSGNTKAASDYCMAFAREHGLWAHRDELGDVVIRKAASPGYESHAPIILQGHLDMVCEKEPGETIDMAREGLRPARDGDFVFARGTTLGGDDGIAVAMILSVLEDDSLAHPPIEALFTVDEETGMYGAAALDPSLLKGRTLLNLDSEDEGVLTVGCAGGARAELCRKGLEEPLTQPAYEVVLGGLIGGHSGVEIDRGRYNANKLMSEFLASLSSDFSLVSLAGGEKDNAIPRECRAVVSCAVSPEAAAAAFAAAHRNPNDPGLFLRVSPAKAERGLSFADSRQTVGLLCELPCGVQEMSPDLPGLVQTSLNLGVLRLKDGELTATFSVRSSVGVRKAALLEQLRAIGARFGAAYSDHGHYPAWEFRAESPLRDVMVAVYERLTGKKPEVVTIHAGLECGLFAEKLPGLDAVSFGPELLDIHTPRERLSISSTARTYAYLCQVIQSL